MALFLFVLFVVYISSFFFRDYARCNLEAPTHRHARATSQSLCTRLKRTRLLKTS